MDVSIILYELQGCTYFADIGCGNGLQRPMANPFRTLPAKYIGLLVDSTWIVVDTVEMVNAMAKVYLRPTMSPIWPENRAANT